MKPSDPSTLLPGLGRGAEILIARLRSLGDIVLETPVIAALHDWRPDLRIFMLIEQRFAPALEGNPAIAGLFFSRGFFETAGELRRRHFPVFFNQHGGPRSAMLAAVSGAPARVGWRGFQFAFVYNVPVPDAAEFYGAPVVHTVEHRISQFYYTGLPRGPIPSARVFPQQAAVERVRAMLAARGLAGIPYAVLQPEARLPAMRWPGANFSEIARWLKQTHGIASIANISASATSANSNELRSALAKVALVPDSLDLQELIALISGATLFVGNDSGPVHLAAALGTPSVVIYGPTNPVQWRPWRVQHRVVSTGAQFRAIRGDKTIAVTEPRAIASISLDEVRAACDDLLASALHPDQHEVPGEISSKSNPANHERPR